MNSLVVYDSQFGNTAQVADKIAKSIPRAKILKANQVTVRDLEDINLLIVGSPTHGGRPTEVLQQFLNTIPSNSLTGTKVAAFDTRFSDKDSAFPLNMIVRFFGYAADKIAVSLQNKGGKLISPPIGFVVSKKSGPLLPTELKRAAEWLHF